MLTKEELLEIVNLAEELPEIYRLKCFELLLSSKLNEFTKPPLPLGVIEKDQTANQDDSKQKSFKEFIFPIDVRAFFSQYSLDEILLKKLFLIDDDQFRAIYLVKETVRSQAQTKLALLMALETALAGGKFEVSKVSLRERCRELKIYDQPNFAANIKNASKFFKEVEGMDVLELSPEGKTELAEVIEEITTGDG